MPAVARSVLGASTTNRKWYFDVDTNNSLASPNWIGVFGLTELTPGSVDANLEDDSDFDSGGFGSQTKTGENWSVEGTVARKVQQGAPTAYDPGQEFLRTKSFGKMGAANVVHVRWYEMEEGGPRVEAYEGFGAVVWNPEGGSPTDLSSASFTVSGQGRLTLIAHPGEVVPVVASLSAITPNTGPTAGGTLTTIKGMSFTGTTGVAGVKFGANNATSYQVIDDRTISAVAPAGTAGAKAVTVTNATGVSTTTVNFTYV